MFLRSWKMKMNKVGVKEGRMDVWACIQRIMWNWCPIDEIVDSCCYE